VDAGLDKVVRIRSGHIHQFQSGESFELKRIGMFKQANFEEILPREIWQHAQSLAVAQPSVVEIPDEVRNLVKRRQAARASKDWEKADVLREQVQALGWQVLDTPDGSEVTPL
jgi:cysteinyl-tRNA synthetase